jgi:glucokinase
MNDRKPVGLVGDIGGTNARFALVGQSDDGDLRLINAQSLAASAYATLEDGLAAYLKQQAPVDLQFISLACAGPVINDHVTFTNMPWIADSAAITSAFNAPRVVLLNDLAAQAWAAPVLSADDLVEIGTASSGNSSARPAALAVLGVGTGTNASLNMRDQSGEHVWVGEAGHVAFAPVDGRELEIWRHLTHRFGRVSVERLASGPGLVNIYQALCAISGHPPHLNTPADITSQARSGNEIAQQALNHFCQIIGSIAGDVALNFGARAGLYLSGGICPTIIDILQSSGFRQRFEAKGRFETYMAAIPTFVITHPFAALLGAARAAMAR